MNETELLFTQVLNCQRASLYLDKDKQLSDSQISFIASVLKRRIKGEPIQYILGRTEFMGLEFKVDKDVLIPRPETEILLETAIGTVHKFASSQVRKLKALDIGTGSGCIAVALAKEFPGLKIDATDVSLEALKMAQGNAKLNGVKINFIQSDLFKNIFGIYDIIISNPPYIPAQEINKLQPEISYEPHLALDGGRDGLNFYRQIIHNATYYLKDGGFLIMEMGFGQKDNIGKILNDRKEFAISETVKDYSGIDRVIVCKKGR